MLGLQLLGQQTSGVTRSACASQQPATWLHPPTLKLFVAIKYAGLSEAGAPSTAVSSACAWARRQRRSGLEHPSALCPQRLRSRMVLPIKKGPSVWPGNEQLAAEVQVLLGNSRETSLPFARPDAPPLRGSPAPVAAQPAGRPRAPGSTPGRRCCTRAPGRRAAGPPAGARPRTPASPPAVAHSAGTLGSPGAALRLRLRLRLRLWLRLRRRLRGRRGGGAGGAGLRGATDHVRWASGCAQRTAVETRSPTLNFTMLCSAVYFSLSLSLSSDLQVWFVQGVVVVAP